MSYSSKGLPGLRGSDHIGFTVPNLSEAVDFFVNVIGCEAFYELGPFSSEGDWMETQLNVQRDTVMKKLRFLRCAHGPNLEIFEYDAPDQRPTPPKNSDVGGHHIAFYVDDFDRALEHLRRHGVEILGDPVVRTSGPSAGQTWIYFLAPWGMQLELLSYPSGKGYEQDFENKLWNPAHPED